VESTGQGAGRAPGTGRGPLPDIRPGAGFEQEWPGASAVATSLVLNLSALVHRIEAWGLELVRRRGISSIGAFNVLTILHGADGPLRPSVIAERMIVTRGTITALLDTLEKRDLIRRRTHAQDGRMRLVEITASGRDMVAELLPQLHQAEQRWMAALTPPEQAALLGLVAKLQQAGPDRQPADLPAPI
jgi:DNA-binding MarR family transcriptional regulator